MTNPYLDLKLSSVPWQDESLEMSAWWKSIQTRVHPNPIQLEMWGHGLDYTNPSEGVIRTGLLASSSLVTKRSRSWAALVACNWCHDGSRFSPGFWRPNVIPCDSPEIVKVFLLPNRRWRQTKWRFEEKQATSRRLKKKNSQKRVAIIRRKDWIWFCVLDMQRTNMIKGTTCFNLLDFSSLRRALRLWRYFRRSGAETVSGLGKGRKFGTLCAPC